MTLTENMREEKPVPLRKKDHKDRLGSVDIKNDPETWQAFGVIARKQKTTRTTLVKELIDNTVNPSIDISSLSPTAKEKLEIAIRKAKRELEIAHAERMKNITEEVRQLVLERTKSRLESLGEIEQKARENEAYYRKMINNHKSPFTIDEFKIILMCLHPDGQRTKEKLEEAFRLFNSMKLQLTKEK